MAEPDRRWRASSFSDGLQCIQVAVADDHVDVRDSKDPAGPALRFTRAEMRAFILGAKAGEFDRLVTGD